MPRRRGTCFYFFFAVAIWHACTTAAQKLLQTLKGHDGMIRAVAFSPDGKLLVSGGSIDTDKNDWAVKVWDVSSTNAADWRLIKSLVPKKGRHDDQVMVTSFRPDGKWLAVADEKGSHIYDLSSSNSDSWAEIRDLKAHKGWGRALAWSKDGKRLFSCSDDATTVVWDLSSENPSVWKKTRILKGHKGGTFSLALSPDGKYIATGGADFTVRVWDISDSDIAQWKEKQVSILKGHKRVIRALAWAPDGKLLVSGSDDGSARLWDMTAANPAEWKELQVLDGHQSTIPSVSFSADSRYIVTGSSDFDQLIKIWSPSSSDPASWKEVVQVPESHEAAVRGVDFWGGVDGKRWLLGTCSDDSEVRVWELNKDTLGKAGRDEL